MLVFQAVVKAGFLVSFSKDNGLAASSCRSRADETGKKSTKKWIVLSDGESVSLARLPTQLRNRHHYESIRFDQLDR
jgi:hypothetical protein